MDLSRESKWHPDMPFWSMMHSRTPTSFCPFSEFCQFIHLIANPDYWSSSWFSYHVNLPLVQVLAFRKTKKFLCVYLLTSFPCLKRGTMPHMFRGTTYSPLLWLFSAEDNFRSHSKLHTPKCHPKWVRAIPCQSVLPSLLDLFDSKQFSSRLFSSIRKNKNKNPVSL